MVVSVGPLDWGRTIKNDGGTGQEVRNGTPANQIAGRLRDLPPRRVDEEEASCDSFAFKRDNDAFSPLSLSVSSSFFISFDCGYIYIYFTKNKTFKSILDATWVLVSLNGTTTSYTVERTLSTTTSSASLFFKSFANFIWRCVQMERHSTSFGTRVRNTMETNFIYWNIDHTDLVSKGKEKHVTNQLNIPWT